MRAVLGVVVAAGVAFACAVVLGEYVLTPATGVAAAVVVPLVVGEAAALAGGRRRPVARHLTAAVLGAGAVALGTWFGTGRGLQAWPGAGTAAVVLAAAWPAALAALGRRRPVSSG